MQNMVRGSRYNLQKYIAKVLNKKCIALSIKGNLNHSFLEKHIKSK